jgi:hypothetical protein
MLGRLVPLMLLAASPLVHVDGPHRLLLSAHGIYTISSLDGARTGWYYDWGELAGIERPNAKRVALLGMGGGEMLRAARRSLPKAELIGLELDPAIAEAARGAFQVEQLGVQVLVKDARAWLAVQPNNSVDVLMVDVYDDARLPANFRNAFFFSVCRRVVGAQGAVLMNVYPAELVPLVAEAMHNGGFPEVLDLDVGKGNHVLWAGPLATVPVPDWVGLEHARKL